MFVYIMPAVLFFIMMNLPSGLILYWTMINVLTIVQQAFPEPVLPRSTRQMTPLGTVPKTVRRTPGAARLVRKSR